MRALTDAEQLEYERIRQRLLAEWQAGEIASVAEYKAKLKAEIAHLGTPIPGSLVAEAVQEHGHLGLGALHVAAEWTLARSPRRVAPRRSAPHGGRSRSRRPRSSRARSPGRRPSADDGDPPDLEEPHPRVILEHAARFQGDPRVALWLERWAHEALEEMGG